MAEADTPNQEEVTVEGDSNAPSPLLRSAKVKEKCSESMMSRSSDRRRIFNQQDHEYAIENRKRGGTWAYALSTVCV